MSNPCRVSPFWRHLHVLTFPAIVFTSSIKPGMHNIVAKEGPSTATRNVQMVKIGRAVPEICLQTDRQTDRHADHNTLFLYRGRSN